MSQLTASAAGLLYADPRSDLGFPGIDGSLGALLKALLPVIAYLAVAPLLWWFFRRTWRELDEEATAYRQAAQSDGAQDHRPAVMFAIAAVVLTMQEYYGSGRFFANYLRPWLRDLQVSQAVDPGGLGRWVDLVFYGELYSYAWWALTRIVGYTVVPLLVWKSIYRKDSLLDMGLRLRGFRKHAWIYLACLVV